MKKLISIILCSSFFILNGGRTLLPIKHNPKRRLYQGFNNAFYAITHAKGKIKKTKNSKRSDKAYVVIKDKIYNDIQNVSEYFKIAQEEINRTTQLKLLLEKDIDRLKSFTDTIIERGKKFSIPKTELRKKLRKIKEDSINIMFKLAIRYQDIRSSHFFCLNAIPVESFESPFTL